MKTTRIPSGFDPSAVVIRSARGLPAEAVSAGCSADIVKEVCEIERIRRLDKGCQGEVEAIKTVKRRPAG